MEKDLNLIIAGKVQKIFTDNGYQVVMTRNEDVSLHDSDKKTVREQKNSDLRNRAEIANQSGARIFISVHLNKYVTSDIRGGQVFYNKGDNVGKEYAKKIMAEFKNVDPENKRVEKELPNKNLLFNHLNIPAVLVECGFVSNSNEAGLLKTDEYQQKLAEAIFKGVNGSN